MKTLIHLLLATTATLGLLGDARAGESHDHGHSHAAPVAIPDTLDELWKNIAAGHAKLDEALEKKDIPAAHEAEQSLQAWLKALPAKCDKADAAARSRIEGQARNLARAYDGIHHDSDHKDWDKATGSLKKAAGALTLLEAQVKKAL